MNPLLASALLSTAHAELPFVGESLRWEVRYAGVTAGHAWAKVEEAEGSLRLSCGARNADWYERFYSIDDLVVSTWVPGVGSRRYETRFREGGFHQDQDMRLDPEGYQVWRHQRFKEGWREWTDAYPATPGAEDPVSAIYALRRLGGEGPWTYPVFSGSETWDLVAKPVRTERLEGTPLGDVDTEVVELKTAHEGQLEQKGRFLLWLTADERRIPVKMVVRTNFGPISANLVDYRPPEGG